MSYVEAFEPYDGPLTSRPRTRAEVVEMFGDPTRGGLYLKVADPKWVARNIVELHGEDALLPSLSRFYVPGHRLLLPYRREAYRRAELAAPGYIQRAGCFVFRHIRHDPDMDLSYHSYGIADDLNSDDNQAVTFKPGKTPVPWSAEWMRIWPRGVPRGVVAAFESCGFSWGGWWRGFCDPMHFEWVGKRDTKV